MSIYRQHTGHIYSADWGKRGRHIGKIHKKAEKQIKTQFIGFYSFSFYICPE
ncbi:hypothetical protein JCM10003_2702 [Bacteroides pyogenes JCM 10003]|nr:hypothetical protein JCM10003_2702 [Bacteroides pyogenes JCM 10003]